MFEASTIMQKELITVRPDTPIQEAIKLMVDFKITGIPVVEGDNRLVGVVSEKDVLKLLYNAQDKTRHVCDFMTDAVRSFEADNTIMEICQCLINNNFRRIPITDDGKLVGVISRKDVIRFILKLRKKETSGN